MPVFMPGGEPWEAHRGAADLDLDFANTVLGSIG